MPQAPTFRDALTALNTSLIKLQKDLGDGAAPPPEGSEQTAPADGDAAYVVKLLGECQQRIGALLGKAEKGGPPPEGMAAELKTIAGTLLTIANAGGGAPVDAPAATPVTQNEKRDGTWIIKALAPEVEMAVTMNTAQDFMYGAMSLMREGKLAEAKTKITSIVGMLNTVGGASAAGGEDAMKNESGGAETVKVELTQEQFVEWSLGQLSKATNEPREAAVKRIAHLQKAADLFSSAFGGERTTNSLVTSIEMISYYAPEGLGKVADVTATDAENQSAKDIPAQTGTPNRDQLQTGVLNAPASTSKPTNSDTGSMEQGTGVSGFSWPAFKSLEAQIEKIAKTHAAPVPVAKGDFSWPMDMSVDEDEEAKRQERINKAETPRASEDDWGKDPWAATT